MKMGEITAAAVELNTVLGCDPAIPVQPGTKKETVIEAIKVAAGLIQEGDTISNETRAVVAFATGSGQAAATPPAAGVQPAAPAATGTTPAAPAADGAAPAPATRTVKNPKPKTEFGHQIGSQAGEIDAFLLGSRGQVLDAREVARVVQEKTGRATDSKRVVGHAKSLQKRKLAEVKVEMVKPEEGDKYQTVQLV